MRDKYSSDFYHCVLQVDGPGVAFLCCLLDLPKGDGFGDGDRVGAGLAGWSDGSSGDGVAGIYTHLPPCWVALGIALLKSRKVVANLSPHG